MKYNTDFDLQVEGFKSANAFFVFIKITVVSVAGRVE